LQEGQEVLSYIPTRNMHAIATPPVTMHKRFGIPNPVHKWQKRSAPSPPQSPDTDSIMSNDDSLAVIFNPFPAGPLPVSDGIFIADPGSGSITNSMTVSAGGIGAVQGVTFTCPGAGPGGHSTTVVELTFHTTAISMDDMKKVDDLVKSLVSASDYAKYHDHAEASTSGGWSLFGGAAVSASASATHDAMSGYGLTDDMQQKVLELVKGLVPKPSTFKYKTTVINDSPFQQSGQMYVYSFTGTITSGNSSESKQMIGGPVAKTSSGDQLPCKTPFS